MTSSLLIFSGNCCSVHEGEAPKGEAPRGGSLWNSMQGKEMKRQDSKAGGLRRQESRSGGMQRQESRNGGLKREDSRNGGLARQESQQGLQRQDSRRAVSNTTAEREPYQGGTNWKESLRGASPSKPVWERTTASSRAKQNQYEGYTPRKTSTVRRPSAARRSRSDSVTRR